VRFTFLPLRLGAIAAPLLPWALGCGGSEARPARPAAVANEPIPVRVATLGQADLTMPVIATGTLSARDEVTLSFKVGGLVEAVSAEGGQRVAAGALLARLAPAEINANVAKATQAVAKARRDLDRFERLYRDSVITLAQREDAETALQIAQQDLLVAQFNAKYAEVRAPSAGVVLRRLSSPGALVGPGTPIVVFRPEDDGVLLRAGLSDRDAARVSPGDRVTVRFDGSPDRAYGGRVTRVAVGANSLSGTYDAEIDLDPSARSLASGLVGRAEIQPSRRVPRLAIPVAALVEADGDSARVFVVDTAASVARLRSIRIGPLGAGMVPVLGGLMAGEQVVVAGAAFVTDGGPIRVTADTSRSGPR
jgi:RND family efflux transporter MFP subunit